MKLYLDSDSDTSAVPLTNGIGEIKEFIATSTLFLCRLVAESSAIGAKRCFIEHTASTSRDEITAAASTKPVEIPQDIKISLERLWDEARADVIVDGMRNVVSERLSEFISRDFKSVVPAIISAIETARVSPLVAAEVFKELGGIHDQNSHFLRLWALEHGLDSQSLIIRDGAGLGLARLADPAALPYLRNAIDREADGQTRDDLQLVADEITHTRS